MTASRPLGGPPGPGVATVWAPAKLTVSLAVVGVRADGYHELRAEMVTLDLADRLDLRTARRSSLEVAAAPGTRAEGLPAGPDNLVLRALELVGRTAHVHLEKRIPVQGGLGGGSADAGAVLRWAGWTDLAAAGRLGSDVPFCVLGGRAEVGGVGERVRPLPHLERSFVLLVPPFGSDTAAVYRAYDDRLADSAGDPTGSRDGVNDLTAAALAVEPRLVAWGEALGSLTGRTPVLAGSGSTWFVEGDADELGVGERHTLEVGGESGQLLAARTVPPGWAGPEA